jgi:hypothetical protein
MNLSWDDYEYEGGGFTFERFYIYRGDAADNLQLLDSIAASFNTYIDDNPPEGKDVYYQIAGVLTNPCNANAKLKADAGPYSHALSNVEENRLEVSDEAIFTDGKKIDIFPNPGNGHFNLKFNNISNQSAVIEVIDITGRKILNEEIYLVDSETLHNIDLSEHSEGVYLLKIRGDSFSEAIRLMIR